MTILVKSNLNRQNSISPNPATFKLLITHPAHFLSLGFGSGLAKKAPGTFGTLAGLPIFWLISSYALITQLAVISGLFLIGIYCCTKTGKALGVADDGAIVWDEIVAIMLVLAFTPLHWFWWLIAFALFRLFDIWKPFPIRQFDAKLKNGFGVMFDDLLAGIYAIAALRGLLWIKAYA
ncbi:MAG: phosphatidylglycerophosphatase A [Pseudomonadota bacterium]